MSAEEEKELNTENKLPDNIAENTKVQPSDLESHHEISFSGNEINNPVDYMKSENNQKLYDGILKKLDIKSEKSKESIQEDFQIKSQLEKVLSQDFQKIQKLVASGLINSKQGQNLKKQVLKKAFDKLVQNEKIKRTSSSDILKNNALEEFSQSNPNFFSSGGRQEVLNYLNSGGVSVGMQELNKISELIRTVEKSAIDRYLQEALHEKTLKNSNEAAKQRLTAHAQKSGNSGNLLKTFTREQIGKMSSSEFAKYEAAIMDALKKGLIK